jgi:hypothetical protein
VSPDREKPSEDVLCERCGYPLESVIPGAACPECGADAEQSDPARRSGTAWQRNRSVGAFVRTLGSVARHPVRAFDRIDPGRGPRGLIAANGIAAGSIAGLCLAAVLVPDLVAGSARSYPGWLPWPGDARLAMTLLLVAIPVVVAGAVVLLSVMEAQGLRMIAWRHGYRFGHRLSLTVVAHAGVGWVVAALFAGPFGAGALAAWNARWSFSVLGMWINAPLVSGVIAVFGTLLGFLAFETLAWVGLRRCRFANTPR